MLMKREIKGKNKSTLTLEVDCNKNLNICVDDGEKNIYSIEKKYLDNFFNQISEQKEKEIKINGAENSIRFVWLHEKNEIFIEILNYTGGWDSRTKITLKVFDQNMLELKDFFKTQAEQIKINEKEYFSTLESF